MFYLTLSSLIVTVCVASSINGEIVITTTGPISGGVKYDSRAGYYSYYEGVPYAEAPIGHLRFRPPVPKSPWKEVYNATQFGHVCPQPEGSATRKQMNEDCLFLNVYVPENCEKKHLPVLVYVHGGEFTSLSGNTDYLYGPQLILKRGIIFITLNYRLGALGFLSLDIDGATGNAGLKDIIQALRWINANIDRFGGDQNRITLGGNSAGAVAVHYLLLSTKSTGLFKQAMLFSGSALGYRFLARHAKDNALTLAKQLDIQTDNVYEILDRLKDVDAMEIVKAQVDMGKNDIRKGFRPFVPFVPSIEIENKDALIADEPRYIIEKGIPQNIPIIVGYNTDDGLKMLPVINKDNVLVDHLNDNFELCIPSNIEYPYGSRESTQLANSIQEFYFDGGIIANETINNFVELITDTMFSYSIDSWINIHKEKELSNKLYYYVFGFEGDLNWFKIRYNVSHPGTAHTDEVGYIFVTEATKYKLDQLDYRSQRMLDIMSTILSNFIWFGNPTPNEEDVGIIWKERGQNRNYLYLSDHLENKCYATNPSNVNLQFWDLIYDQYYQYLENGGILEAKVIP